MDNVGQLSRFKENALSRILIAYFSRPKTVGIDGEAGLSRKGATEQVVDRLQALTGAEVYRIYSGRTYTDNADRMGEEAKAEKESNARPPVKGNLPDISGYDTVILAYPIWHGTVPMVVRTFLESLDFTGRTIIPVATHEISNMGESEQDIQTSAPAAQLLPGTPILASSLGKADDALAGIAEVAMNKEAYL